MQITELSIRNVKRLEAFGIAPETGEPIILTGDNGAGKSSVLDAIFLALTGKGLNDPIRHGASKAVIKLALHGEETEYTVEKVITKKSCSLKITGKDGAVISSPQSFLDSLVGSLAFDPLEFVRLKPKQQAAAIRELVGLDTSKLDSEYKVVYAERAAANRQINELEAQLKATPEPEPAPLSLLDNEVEEAELSASALISERDEMLARSATRETASRRAAEVEAACDLLSDEIEELVKRAEGLKEKLTTERQRCAALQREEQAAIERAPSRDALDDITAKISSLDAENQAIRDRNAKRRDAQQKAERASEEAERRRYAYSRLNDSLAKARGVAEGLTSKLEAIEERKAKLTREAQMPVEGMTFDEDGVFIDGVRFDQLSTAEQVRVSASVAMRGNPKLRLILVREGALLNKANLKAICEAAKDGGYQIFIEKFQETPGDQGLHIEDGSVTHIDGERVVNQEEAA